MYNKTRRNFFFFKTASDVNYQFFMFILPQDVYQTAKVSKLLIAINKGKNAMYRVKSFEEIECSDNVDTYNETDTFNSQVKEVSGPLGYSYCYMQ